MTESEARKKVVSIVNKWVGGRQGSAIHREILDIWNDYAKDHGKPHAYESYAWCAETASAAQIKAGFAKYVPISLSCGDLIAQAKELGIWVENDAHHPKIADQVIYGWDAPKTGDAPGKYYHDHVGTVVATGKDTFIVVEGNAGSPSQVRKLTRGIDFNKISGFICPDYKMIAKKLTPATSKPATTKPVASKPAQEKPASTSSETTYTVKKGDTLTAIAKKYGTTVAKLKKLNNIANANVIRVGQVLKLKDSTKPASNIKEVKASHLARSESSAYDHTYVVTDGLNLRDGAGTDYKILVTMPRNSKVRCYGFYTMVDGTPWLYVEYMDGNTKYTGFCSKKWLLY